MENQNEKVRMGKSDYQNGKNEMEKTGWENQNGKMDLSGVFAVNTAKRELLIPVAILVLSHSPASASASLSLPNTTQHIMMIVRSEFKIILNYDDNCDSSLRHEIASFKESLEEIASEAREERRNIIGMVREVDVALEEMIHEVREERDNLHIRVMLAELLAEIQHTWIKFVHSTDTKSDESLLSLKHLAWKFHCG
jgi:vacuolar-type H+-ATPase subunit H